MKRRIGLYGIGGVYNFGCEAIVRGAVKLIKRLNPDAEIIYFSRNFTYDFDMLKDLAIEICNVESNDRLLNKILRRLATQLRYEHRPLKVNFHIIMNRVDEIWSIGGDIYTIPEIRRDDPKYDYYNPLVDFCDKAIDNRKTVVLYGASVGPFGSNKQVLDYYINSLKRYRMILCRENESFAYLKSVGLDNIMFFPDPAFQVRDDIEPFIYEKRYIGLNFSPLSLDEIYGNHEEDSQTKVAKVIETIIQSFKMEILFIPHVISKVEYDDDLRFQKKIIDLVDPILKEKIVIADYKGGFLGLKPQLRLCKFVVSARMHCAINAIVESVPTILLSYSQKAVGMGKYIYNNDRWIVNLKDMDSKLIPVMHNMDIECESVSDYLKKRVDEIERDYNRLKNELKLR